MNRRSFLFRSSAAFAGLAGLRPALSAAQAPAADKVVKTPTEWKKALTADQYYVLREEGTERAFTSPLNNEKRKGTFVCAGCDLPLFKSDTKYESGTGWPSFWAPIEGAVATKVDYKLIYPRTEYHCRRCEGHQGHVFDDGPKPTGKRYCNNGVALKFIAAGPNCAGRLRRATQFGHEKVSTESFGAAGRLPCGKGTKRADRRRYAARSVARACALNASAHIVTMREFRRLRSRTVV